MMLKKLALFIAITLPVIGSCQTQICGVTQRSFDSVVTINRDYFGRLSNATNIIMLRDEQILGLVDYSVKQQRTIDSLKYLPACNIKLGANDTTSFVTDTANFKIVWDEATGADMLICKDGKDFKFVFIDTDKNRIYLQKADTTLSLSVYKDRLKVQSPKFKL